ncbi:type II toxin-antitoxin system PemK/MazF family toxin [Myxococcota bacterium]|nr:type II toxin-antitoxin system PemK/MazF family toxin [Myxococcota bacterium]
MKRGEIWWADVDKKRPVVLISRQEAYEVRALVIAAPVSTMVRGFAVEVKVGKREGLPKSGVINCDWLVTIPKSALKDKIGTLSSTKINKLDEALKFALGLDE